MSRYTQQHTATTPHKVPYYVPASKTGGNLFQKIKGFFNTNSQQQQQQPQQQPQEEKRVKKPYNFGNVNVSAIDLSVNQSNLSFVAKNPNDTLSEFFNKKGDDPLNDIEIEGVMSLIRKSQSRAPSRNTSGLFNHTLQNNHNRSMLLNSHMDSKLNAFTSFNQDANNTTILRPASNNMKVPVKISTPTFVSRKSSNTANTSVNNSSIMNMSTAHNTSRSFINNGGIRKRRIVDYSSLQSPYKLKNTSSSLSTFLEKKKLLEKQANEEKSKSLLSTPAVVAEEKKEKKSKEVYTGGVIDLSALDDEEDAHFAKKKTLKPAKQNAISKTASRVLDILNFDDAKVEPVKVETKKEEPKKEIKPVISVVKPVIKPLVKPIIPAPVEDDDSIIIIDEKPAVKPLEKSQPAAIKFEFNTQPKKETQEPLKPVEKLPAFNFQPKNDDVKPKIKFGFKPQIKTEPKLEKKEKPMVQSTLFDSTFKPAAPAEPVKATNSFKFEPFETKPQMAPSFTLSAPSTTPPTKSVLPAKEESEEPLEVIDSFAFPEVEEPIVLDEETEQPEKDDEDMENEEDEEDEAPQTNGNTNTPATDFTFPIIPGISEQTLRMAQNAPTDLYNDVFRF